MNCFYLQAAKTIRFRIVTEIAEVIHDWSDCIWFVEQQRRQHPDLLFTGFYERAAFVQVFTHFEKACVNTYFGLINGMLTLYSPTQPSTVLRKIEAFNYF